MNAMTAHELAQQLLDGPDLPVHFSYNYNDHWRTQVAPKVTQVEEGAVTHSSYHNMDKVIEDDEGDESIRRVILLS